MFNNFKERINKYRADVTEQERIAHNISIEARDKSCMYKTGATIAGLSSLFPKGRMVSFCVFGVMSFQALRMESRILDCQNFMLNTITDARNDIDILKLKLYTDEIDHSCNVFEHTTLRNIMMLKGDLPRVHTRAKNIERYREPNPRFYYLHNFWSKYTLV